MKILLLNYNNPHTGRIADILADEKHTVRIINIGKNKIKPSPGIDVSNLKYFYPKPNTFIFNKILLSMNNIPFYKAADKNFMKQNTDLILCMDKRGLPILNLIGKKFMDKIPFFVFLDGTDLPTEHKKVLIRAKGIILPDNRGKVAMTKYIGAKGRIQVINYGVVIKEAPRKKAKIAMDVAIETNGKIREDDKFILCNNPYTTEYYALLAALCHVKGYKLVVISPMRNKTMNMLARAFHIDDRVVFFTGGKRQVVFAAADIYFTTDKYSKNTIMAMKHGIRIINPMEFKLAADGNLVVALTDTLTKMATKKHDYGIDYSWETFRDEIGKLLFS